MSIFYRFPQLKMEVVLYEINTSNVVIMFCARRNIFFNRGLVILSIQFPAIKICRLVTVLQVTECGKGNEPVLMLLKERLEIFICEELIFLSKEQLFYYRQFEFHHLVIVELR